MNKELTRLQTVIRELIQQLRNNVFYKDSKCISELSMTELFFENITADQLMNHVVMHVLPHAERIRSRDKQFFYSNRSIFARLPNDRVEFYANYFMNKCDTETLDTLWKYFDVILALVESYRKRK